MTVTITDETAEAIASGLHQAGFIHAMRLRKDPTHEIWFTRGESFRKLHVVIGTHRAPYVTVTKTYPTMAPGHRYIEQVITINTEVGSPVELFDATVHAVESCIATYADVLEGRV